MQFFAGPLKELAEYEEIQKKRTEKKKITEEKSSGDCLRDRID